MKGLWKKAIGTVLIASMVAGVTACGSSDTAGSTAGSGSASSAQAPDAAAAGSSSAADSSASAAASTSAKQASGEITVWTKLSQEEIDSYIAMYNKVNPNVKVNAVVIPTDTYMQDLLRL